MNHDDKKVLIQGELIECKRGQSILSLAGWVKCFGKKWTMQRVRTFFELLKRDEMIITEGLRKTTRLTVCKYNDYQISQQAENKQTTSREQAENKLRTTNKNDKERIKKYIYSAFYDLQLEGSTDPMYESFVKFLFGENDLGRPLNKLLKMDDQIGVKQFEKLKATSEETGRKILDTCRDIENYTKKTYSSFYLTLNKWLKNVR